MRGKLTQKELVDKVGWSVPDVYGDPALLVPDCIPPAKSITSRIAVVPHYVHRPGVVPSAPKDIKVVDVRRDIAHVADAVSSSQVVISTSLHGLITAQAYGVPWVWLRVSNRPLTGADFKFEDFFSCLDRKSVAIVTTDTNSFSSLDYENIASRASLPELTIDLSALRRALPTPPAARPVPQIWDPLGTPDM